MKDWRSVVLVALVSLLLGRESAHTTPEPPDPGHPLSVRFSDPIQVNVTLSTPVGPRPPPLPTPSNDPPLGDTPLARAAREYIRALPTGLPALWHDMADRIERGEINDKIGAVQAHNQLSSPLNSSLDQLFAIGMDARGKIVNRAAIVNPLRQSAAALGRPD